jgi:hypothetical protein
MQIPLTGCCHKNADSLAKRTEATKTPVAAQRDREFESYLRHKLHPSTLVQISRQANSLLKAFYQMFKGVADLEVILNQKRTDSLIQTKLPTVLMFTWFSSEVLQNTN